MKFSVCIPTIRPNTVASAIASVLRQSFRDWELIVVGQGDENVLRPVVEAAAAGDPRVRYLHLPRRGLSVARNAAIAATSGEIIALIDDDCEGAVDWLETVNACFEKDPELGLVGGSLVPPRRELRVFAVCPAFVPPEVVYDPVASGRTAPAGWGWVGGNFAVRRSVAEKVGPFDEYLGAGTYFAAAEDTDYMLRLELLGVKMLSTPRAVVHHTHGYRYGLKAFYDHKRNYARGNGALAGKLTLMGDARGQAWVDSNIEEATSRVKRLRLHQVPASVFRLFYFMKTYRECLDSYEVTTKAGKVDPTDAVLAPLQKA